MTDTITTSRQILTRLAAARTGARNSVGNLDAEFHHWDANRFEWLAKQLQDAECMAAAALALDWAQEHRETAQKIERADREMNDFRALLDATAEGEDA